MLKYSWYVSYCLNMNNRILKYLYPEELCWTCSVFFIVCDNRKYGQTCNKSCGHCLNQGFCHHENGACLSGCDPGFHGVLCTSRKHRSFTLFSFFYFTYLLIVNVNTFIELLYATENWFHFYIYLFQLWLFKKGGWGG